MSVRSAGGLRGREKMLKYKVKRPLVSSSSLVSIVILSFSRKYRDECRGVSSPVVQINT